MSEIDWGSFDANTDKQFLERFIEPDAICQLLKEKFWIVTGEKGSGKTAIKRALEEGLKDYGKQFSYITSLSFNTLEFETFKVRLIELSRGMEVSPLKLMINYWQYVIILQAIKVLKNDRNDFNPKITDPDLIKDLQLDLASNEGDKAPGIAYVIRQVIERAWKTWANIPIDSQAEQQSLVIQYPTDKGNFLKLVEEFNKYTQSQNIRILVILDGFDTLCIDAQQREHIHLVFSALAEAVHDLYRDQRFQKGNLVIKALIPHDRFISMQLRDMDKIREVHLPIRWDHNLLRQFVTRRLNVSLGNTLPFEKSWQEVVPEKIENSHYKIDELSFDYIMRHTMWRPRQFQQHLVHLGRMYPNTVIDSGRLQSGVGASCQLLVQDFIQEYRIDHPNLDHFIRLFRRKPNIIPYSDFADIVKFALSRFESSKRWILEDKIEALFTIGFFGFLQFRSDDHQPEPPHFRDKYRPPRKSGVKPYCCVFYYSQSSHQPVLPRLESDTKIALHPIFFDYCEQEPDSSFIVG